MAIAIGRDVHLASLQQFIGNDEIRPVEASHPEALVQQIRWVSRSGIDSVSQVLDGGRRWTVGDLANNSAGTVDDAVEW